VAGAGSAVFPGAAAEPARRGSPGGVGQPPPGGLMLTTSAGDGRHIHGELGCEVRWVGRNAYVSGCGGGNICRNCVKYITERLA
jgi:hypothetical protein